MLYNLQRYATTREISPHKATQHPRTNFLTQFQPPPRHTSTHTTQTRTSGDAGKRPSVSGWAGASSRGRNQTSAEAEADGLPAHSRACRLGCALSKHEGRRCLAGLLYGGDPSGSDKQIQVDLEYRNSEESIGFRNSQCSIYTCRQKSTACRLAGFVLALNVSLFSRSHPAPPPERTVAAAPRSSGLEPWPTGPPS